MATTLSSNYWTATATSTGVSVLAPDTTKNHVPGYKLPVEERMQKFDQHKFGLCVSCDAGLDDYSDFVRDPVTFTPGLMCNDCVHFYNAGSSVALRVRTEITRAKEELSALITGELYLGDDTQTLPTTRFEEEWALAETSQDRAILLAFYSPTASLTLTRYQRSILMDVTLPATKSNNPEAELTFCDGTLRKRVCDFAYCVEDSEGGGGYWYCDACRNFADQQEQDED